MSPTPSSVKQETLSELTLRKVAELNQKLDQRKREALPATMGVHATRRPAQGRLTAAQPPWVSSMRSDGAASSGNHSTGRKVYRAHERPHQRHAQFPQPRGRNQRPHAPASAPRRPSAPTPAPTPAASRGPLHVTQGPAWAPAKKAPTVTLPETDLPQGSPEEGAWSIAAVRPQSITSPGTFRRGYALESGGSWWEEEQSDSESESGSENPKRAPIVVFKTSSSATASQEAPAAEKSAVATQEQASQEEKGQGIPKPVAPAQQESAQRAEQAAERPSALEVQQLEGGSLMATNPVYEEAEAVAQRPAAVEDFSAVVENDAFVPTSPVQEAAGAAAPVSVSEAALGESIPAAAEGAPAATGGWDAPALAAPVETMWGDLSVEAAFHAASQPAYWEPVGGAPKASVQPQESSAEGLSGPEAQQVQAQSNWAPIPVFSEREDTVQLTVAAERFSTVLDNAVYSLTAPDAEGAGGCAALANSSGASVDVPSVEAVPQDAAAVLEPVAAEQQLSAQPAPDCAEERSAIETLDMQPGEGLDVLQVEKPVDSMAKKECQGAEQGAAVMDAPMSMLEMGAALEEGTQSLPEDSEEDERSALEAPPVLSCDDLEAPETRLPLSVSGCEPEEELQPAEEADAESWSAEECAAKGSAEAPSTESAVAVAQGEEVSVALGLPVAPTEPLGLACPDIKGNLQTEQMQDVKYTAAAAEEEDNVRSVSALDSAAAEAANAASTESKLASEQREDLALAASDLSLVPSEALGLPCHNIADTVKMQSSQPLAHSQPQQQLRDMDGSSPYSSSASESAAECAAVAVSPESAPMGQQGEESASASPDLPLAPSEPLGLTPAMPQSIKEGAQVEAGTFSTTLPRFGEHEAASPGSVKLLITAGQKATASPPSPPSPPSLAENLSRGSDKRELAADSLPVEDGGLSDSMSGSCQTDVLHPESSAELPVSCSTSDASQAPAAKLSGLESLEDWVEHGTLFDHATPQGPPKTGTFRLLPVLRRVFLGPWGGCSAHS